MLDEDNDRQDKEKRCDLVHPYYVECNRNDDGRDKGGERRIARRVGY